MDTEIAILKVLNHPHVLQLYEVYFEPSTTAAWLLFLRKGFMHFYALVVPRNKCLADWDLQDLARV